MISAKEAKSHSKAEQKKLEDRIFKEKTKRRKDAEKWAKNSLDHYLKEIEKEIKSAVKSGYESTSIRLPGDDSYEGVHLLANLLSTELRNHGYKTDYKYYRTHDIDYQDDHWSFEVFWGSENV